MQQPLNVGIVGASGAVGQELLSLMESRNFAIGHIRLFTSEKSAGRTIVFSGRTIAFEALKEGCFKGLDLVFFSAGSKISKACAHKAVEAGAIVIDNSSAFRMQQDVPLVIPEINPEAIEKHNGIIANPNCATIIMLMALAPLHRDHKIKRIVAATYQAASGAGALAMQDLEEETRAHLEKKHYVRSVIPFPYAFNLFLHTSALQKNGYVEEELKLLFETRKILADESIRVTATCVRVPVLRAHSEALNVEFHSPISASKAYDILRSSPGVEILEDKENNRFPMPHDAIGKHPIYCGRIREDLSQENTLELWVVGDQLLKGAALNAIQIAELLLQKKDLNANIQTSRF